MAVSIALVVHGIRSGSEARGKGRRNGVRGLSTLVERVKTFRDVPLDMLSWYDLATSSTDPVIPLFFLQFLLAEWTFGYWNLFCVIDISSFSISSVFKGSGWDLRA